MSERVAERPADEGLDAAGGGSAGWVRACAERWDGGSVSVLTAPPPVVLPELWTGLVTASEPFRAGTRFRTLPDVRLQAADGRVNAPGELLPGEPDGTAAAYLDRVGRSLPEGFALVVEQPFVLDHALWAPVRDVLASLWDAVGHPVLPLDVTVRVADRVPEPVASPTHVTLLWVLHGAVRVDRPDDRELTVSAGGLLHCPASDDRLVAVPAAAVTLTVRVPVDGGLVTAAVRDAVADVLQANAADPPAPDVSASGPAADGTVPYLPFPPGPADAARPVAGLATAVLDTLAGAELDRVLRLRWARRCSAAALEPVPPLREDVPPAADDTIRRGREVQRTPAGDGRVLWTVDGHGFTVGGTAADAVWDRLPAGRAVPVRELCAEVGAGTNPAPVQDLVRTLHRLRAVDVVRRSER